MKSSTCGAGAVVLALLLLAVPGTAAAGPIEGITVETPLGPVTCAPDPAREPGPEAITTTPFTRGVMIAINETGALRCAIPMFGEVEVTGAGLPWHLALNEKRLTGRLKGSPKPALLVQSVAIPALSCRYQAGRVIATATAGSSPALRISATRVRLSRTVSSSLCPALGSVNFSLTLP